MKLISLTANKPSFHSINFKDGLNIIVGKQAVPRNENDGNTYNGVGKSLVLHLIHYCLGSNKIDSFVDALSDWEFTLRFEIDDKEYFAKRAVNEQNKVDFSGESLSLSKMRETMFSLCFGEFEPPKSMTWTTLFSRFVRRYRVAYSSFDTYIPKENDYSKVLNNCLLLGIDIDLIVRKKELRDRQTRAKNTENAIKNDDLFKQYYLGRSDAELDITDIEYRIREIEKVISSFKVSNNYHELEKEANEKSYEKKMLENRRSLINNSIKNIEESTKETIQVNEEKVSEIYKAATIEIPEMIKKDIADVLDFHKELLSARNTRLRKELYKHKEELRKIDGQILLIGSQMDELLDFLDSHGALEEYVALTKRLSSMQNKLNRIQEYQKILKAYKETERSIKGELLEADTETDEYLESESELLSELRGFFVSLAKRFYPNKRSGLVLNNNSGENMLRYSLDARIEDDSSDGVNEVRIFCFDLLILTRKISKMRFLAHDSRLFANMDPRQRETLFRVVYDICNEEGLQYICSINEDALDSFSSLMSNEEYRQIVSNNIILELNDDAPESKLLGIQVDINLEGKNKSAEI